MSPNQPPDPVEIPAIVRRFLSVKIDSIPHLEALLLLRDESNSSWHAESVSKRLYIAPDAATNIMLDLAKMGLVIQAGHNPPQWQYHARSGSLDEAVHATAAFYSRNVRVVADLVHAKSKPVPQLFADAFRLRRNKDE